MAIMMTLLKDFLKIAEQNKVAIFKIGEVIKENINLLLSEWGDENLYWNMEIGDNESNSKYGNYFTITASEEEIDGLDDEDE